MNSLSQESPVTKCMSVIVLLSFLFTSTVYADTIPRSKAANQCLAAPIMLDDIGIVDEGHYHGEVPNVPDRKIGECLLMASIAKALTGPALSPEQITALIMQTLGRFIETGAFANIDWQHLRADAQGAYYLQVRDTKGAERSVRFTRKEANMHDPNSPYEEIHLGDASLVVQVVPALATPGPEPKKSDIAITMIDKDRGDAKKGTQAIRRKDARVAATGQIVLGDTFKSTELRASAPAVDTADNKTVVQTITIYNLAMQRVLGDMQDFNDGRNIVRKILARLRGLGAERTPVQFLHDNDVLCDFRPLSNDTDAMMPGGIGIDLDIMTMAEELQIRVGNKKLKSKTRDEDMTEPLVHLVAMSILHELGHAAGIEDEREAMQCTLEFFEMLTSDQRDAVIKLLRRSKTIDASNSFAFFLEMATNYELPFKFLGIKAGKMDDRERQTRINAWQEMWISWILFRTKIDDPFNSDGVRKAMLEAKTPAELRSMLFDVMKSSYNKDLDEANIRRMHEDALERGEKIFYVLFGRAFWYPGALIADSKNVNTSVLVDAASQLRQVCDSQDVKQHITDELGKTEELNEEIDRMFDYISSPMDRLMLLVTRPDVRGVKTTRAELLGALHILDNQFEEYFWKAYPLFIKRLREDNKARIIEQKKSAWAMAVYQAHEDELRPGVEKLHEELLKADPAADFAHTVQSVVVRSKYRTEIKPDFGAAARSRLEDQIASLEIAFKTKADQVRTFMTEIRQAIDVAPQTDAANIILGRRISKDIGAYDTAMVMYMVDPFTRDWTGGENPRISELLRDSADKMYISQSEAALEYSSEILIPLPLFIWENQIDYKQLEGTLRSWFGAIYRNITRARDSGFVALAREIVVMNSPEKDKLDGVMSPEEREGKIRAIINENENLIKRAALLAAVIRKAVDSSEELSLAIARYMGKKQEESEDVEYYDALRAVITEDRAGYNPVSVILAEIRSGNDIDEVLSRMVVEGELADDVEHMTQFVAKRREVARNIMIGTTQSLGMTEYLLGYWMLEELFLNKVRADYNLNGEITAKTKEYNKLLALAAGQLVKENPVLESELGAAMFREDSPERDKALLGLVRKFEDISRQSASLLLLADMAIAEKGLVNRYAVDHRGILVESARTSVIARHNAAITAYMQKKECSREEAITRLIDGNNERKKEIENEILSLAKIQVVKDLLPEMDEFKFSQKITGGEKGAAAVGSVNDYISTNNASLRERAVSELLESYKDEIDNYLLANKVERVDALKTILGGESAFNEATDKITRQMARNNVTEILLHYGGIIGEHPGDMTRYLDGYVYDRQDIASTTAAKEVVGRHGFSQLVLDPRYVMGYKGLFKVFNYSYDPSRVDLGPRTEFPSVEEWAQWIGATDIISAYAAERTMGLFNYNPVSFLRPWAPEAAKPNENTGLLAAAIKGTIDALAYNAAGWGDAETMMYLSNQRTRPSPTVEAKPAQETSAGFCLPKDWEFVRFCLSLTNHKMLEYYGIRDERDKIAVMALAEELLDDLRGRKTTEQKIAGLAKARRKMSDNATIRKYFTVTREFLF
ncbi:MAG: hypothetical protein ABH885_00770, partial [Candidatus Omnitrophota bacterium]